MLQCKLYKGNIFFAGEASGDDNDNVLPQIQITAWKNDLLTNKCQVHSCSS